MPKATIVKMGGSSIRSPELIKWIAAIEQNQGPTVLVPGGGPFAGTVRKFQPQIGYGDEVAHEMAILAMEQFGCILANLSDRFVAARSMAAMNEAWRSSLTPVWMPRDMVMRAPEIPQNWSVTSDSIAAWLAGQFAGARLCLVKMFDVPADSTIEALARADIVDDGLASMLQPDTELFVAGPADRPTAGQRFAVGGLPGRPIPFEAVSRSPRPIEAAQ